MNSLFFPQSDIKIASKSENFVENFKYRAKKVSAEISDYLTQQLSCKKFLYTPKFVHSLNHTSTGGNACCL